MPVQANRSWRSVRLALSKPSLLFDGSPNRGADRGVIEQYRADCRADSDSYRHTESHDRDLIQVLWREYVFRCITASCGRGPSEAS
ncbi:hypothetical protein ACU8M5_08400 [Rhizobium leguminosarum]